MHVTHLKIKKLYGYLNKDIEFNRDINLLVGINGSGKTSILNVVNWLLTPSFPHLCTTEFDELTLKFVSGKHDYILFCKQYENEVTIDIENLSNNEKYPRIQADISYPISKLNDLTDIEGVFESYFRLKPDPEETDTYKLLFNKIPNPIVIGLDRNLYTEEGDDVSYLEDSNRSLRRKYMNKRKHFASPLARVKNYSNSAYTKYRNKVLDLNKNLNNRIMLSSFESTNYDDFPEVNKQKGLTINQVINLEKKVKIYFEENVFTKSHTKGSFQNEAKSIINKYFENLKDFLTKESWTKEDPETYLANVNQFQKIRGLIKEFESFEKDNKKLYQPINEYLETINSFLEDSAKEVYFDKSTSNLRFNIYNKKGSKIDDDCEVDNLSSGEKQILILFTYIKFNDRPGTIFIIDEPELSLHPKWQESFLEGIKKIMPENTQLLFATHSPTIVGNNKQYCKTLLPY